MSGKRIQDARRQEAAAAGAVVGVDAGKVKHAFAVRTRGGQDSRPFEVTATRDGFEEALARIREITPGLDAGQVIVGIEFAGVCGGTLASYLDERGFRVVSVLPRTTKRWNTVVHRAPNKTDALDALTILDLAAAGRFVAYPFQKPGYSDLRNLASAHQRLTMEHGGHTTRLLWALHSVFPELEGVLPSIGDSIASLAFLSAFPTPGAVLSADAATIQRVAREGGGRMPMAQVEEIRAAAERSIGLPFVQSGVAAEIPMLVERMRLCDRQLAEVQQLMDAVAASLPETEYLLTMPQVGRMMVAMFLGAIGDPHSYASAEAVHAHAGISLISNQSGKRTGAHRISRSGHAGLRHQLYLLAMRYIGLREDRGLLRDRYDTLRLRMPSHRKAMIPVMRHVLNTMYVIARDRVPFDAVRFRTQGSLRSAKLNC
jgi:transposase